ncbi:ferredoxin, 2fe-2s-like protein [Leishmania infantum JPCM5]|uniref:Ferredoxin, 2fe-2s-like protein n=2 Tax=Leishmania infantum TaxID=5671 RepID=A4I758_LEIIN|nr:ferredoxin, 2fe-2s-like protein [Leishmania infantum JPCM5]CAC9520962.1 ferredoxin_-_2fe-2s-like_protein [Leishmania infantum]CAM70637.1 ferredoxin, 2fe-2s-like protein [Leishmania infantum JPCM5]SUZ44487.1 ferredoxin_-_2fe-2s-like_protein [Leishmania infantum]|eukprot:XP_001467577.1 ferredoxin, 2fe-2s-like protein [Leishmania infantum JPCM5]
MFVRRRGFSLVTLALPRSLSDAMSPIKLSRSSCSSETGPSPPSASSTTSLRSETPGKVLVRIRDRAGATYERMYNEGDNLMEAIRDDTTLPVEVPGACNGTCQCSTCHVLLRSAEWLGKVEKLFAITDAEQDCLDKAPGVSDASRLSCQLTLSGELNGIEIDLPTSTLDVRWQAAYRRSTKK